jgi:hypothetical protein
MFCSIGPSGSNLEVGSYQSQILCLTFHDTATITAVKCFIVQALGGSKLEVESSLPIMIWPSGFARSLPLGKSHQGPVQ